MARTPRTARAGTPVLACAAALIFALAAGPALAQSAAEPAPIEAGLAPPPGPYAPGFDAIHYDFALALPDSGSYIRGRAVARIALVEPRHDTLPLDLSGLAVERVRVDGRDVAFGYEAGKLRIPVPETASVGDTLTVDIAYAGTPDDGLILGTNVHGARTVFADNWPNRARFWFPSIDHPGDKATVSFAVSAPEPWVVIGNGAPVDDVALEPPPGPPGSTARRSAWAWATDVPIPTYTMVIGAAELAVDTVGVAGCEPGERAGVRTEEDACIAVTTWIFPSDTANAAPSFRRADRMLEFYAELIAPFPYRKLAHVQSSTRFGGMENVGAIFYSERAIAAGRDIEGTVAHETAHQWFGDAVTEADWRHLWLSEGFASYFGPLYFEHADGAARLRELMEEERRGYVESEVVDRPIVDPDVDRLFDLLNANSYNKGAWVLHMLRGVIGDDAFFDGVRRYYRAHEHGTALTDDLVHAVEQSSGRELDWFFEQWVYRPGHPRFRIDWRWDAASREVVVTIRQVQPETWPTFRTPIELEFDTTAGRVRRAVEIDEREEVVRFVLDGEPSAVRLDPDGWVLKEVVSS